ncbi:DNA replication/repair protein RecF [Sedimentibacter sp. MB31-C6]|uniref:DNA replication/repair protein RecF n=1 Tax=Sedimentibacter sp. MB31-C6 TaxID=3109366 RepID=UPI002DDD2C2D|nr:DNA replication/repair protein RecF [Sedimentibacter sp. MB36-C1]WSI05455.1 DNA replication/repair protein RecF [Sedimentibacter sp. MB36-C1]
MIVNSLKLRDYRNLKEVNIDLDSVLNIFIGDNGQGKTNLLESIYLCSIGRTFRLNKESELINFEENKSLVELSLIKNNYKINIELILEKNKRKQVFINKVKLDKTSEMIGILNNVIFTPDDMKIIKGSPVERRKFINIDISQIKPKYKYLLAKYKKIITERNIILKNYCTKPDNKDIINIWNDYLINIGTEIIYYRNEYINNLKKFTIDIYSDISGNKEKLDINYICNIGNVNDMDKSDIKDLFRKKISSNFQQELQKCTTLYGPNKDDLSIKINGKECKYFGSQGQQRSAILAVKLAEIEIIKNEIGEYPILLLDDVLSELDSKRKGYLLNYIKNIQTVITTTDDNDLYNLTKYSNKKNFYISEGKIGNITN